jgi:type I restriction enzyme S subunit
MKHSDFIPTQWEFNQLGKLCENLDKKRKPISKQKRISGQYPYYGATGVLDYVNDYIFDERLVLIGEDGAKWGKGEKTAFFGEGKYWVNNHVHVLKPYRDQVLDEWIVYYLNHLDLSVYITGLTVPKLNQTKLREIPIPLPPLSEQKRIVEILDEAFEGIDRAIANTQKNLANARELFDSYLNYQLLEIASQEPIQTLSCITNLIIDCEHKTAPTQETGFPSIRTPNIGKGYLILNNVNRVSKETYELWTKRGKPESGDLILAREASAGNVGVIPKGETVCLGQRTVLIRPEKNRIDSQFLAFLILHPIMQKRLLSKSTGATVQHVNMKDIRKLAISQLPTIQLQQEYVKDLKKVQSETQRLETIYQRKLEALQELKQSLLHKAFTGELTNSSTSLSNNPTVKEVAA